MSSLSDQISSRRTFAIISHPDAGKTTLTEKLLLYTGSIQTAGSVKGKSSSKHAVSDWMDIEKERGISVTSSVLQFTYNGCCVNILDTPGHQDFSEDTYRTLMAADAAVMVIDAAKGVEAQTNKLFKVCTLRHIPIFTFVNKLDREARDPFELMEEIENVLGINTYPMNWPIGCGATSAACSTVNPPCHRLRGRRPRQRHQEGRRDRGRAGRPGLDELIGEENHRNLMDDIELLDGAGDELDLDAVSCGKLTPAFFGSALTNFGVEPFLQEFLRLAPPAALHRTLTGEPVEPSRDDFSGFVFKIQANMDKNHRDRIAFVRICSGKFERGMDAFHMQGGAQAQAGYGHLDDGRRPRDRRRGLCRRHRGPVRSGHLLHWRYGVHGQAACAVPASHVRTRAFCAHHAGRHPQAQAVREGYGGACPGGRHPDFPRAGCRHGERHRGRCGRAAVRGA